MELTLETLIFYLLLVDAVVANLMAWSKEGSMWYKKNFRTFSRYFPATKGWTSYYLLLVLWIGYLVFKV